MTITTQKTTIDSTMAKIVLYQRAQQNKKLAMAFRVCLNKPFYNDIVNRALTNRNIIISWYGTQGSGKTFAGFYIDMVWAKHTRTVFNTDNIAFTNDELLAKFGELKKNTIYHRDEQIDIFGIGSEREEAAVENVGAVARAQKLSLIYCSPDLRLRNVHYVIESTGIINEEKRTAVHIVYDSKGEKPIGWITTKIPELPKNFWSKYNLIKDNFITAVRQQQPVDRTAEYEKLAEEFVAHLGKTLTMNDGRKARIPDKFSSKKAVKIMLMSTYKKNYTRDEWIAVNDLIDMKCRERGIVPYTFTQW